MSLYLCRAKWKETTYNNEGFENPKKDMHDEIRLVEADSRQDASIKFVNAIEVHTWFGMSKFGGKYKPYADVEIHEVIK